MTAVEPDRAVLETVGCSAAVRVQVTVAVTHRCPFRDETDDGTATISWTTTDQTVELWSLKTWIARYACVQVSHEDLTDTVRGALTGSGMRDVEVTTHWVTAGMGVQVCAVPRQRKFGGGA